MNTAPVPFSEESASLPIDGRLSARMIERALAQVQTTDQAREVIRELHRLDNVPSATLRAATTAAASIRTAAARIVVAQPLEDSVTDHNVLCATNPATAGAGRTDLEPHRRRLRTALVRELKPYQAADTAIFLEINGLPHPRWW